MASKRAEGADGDDRLRVTNETRSADSRAHPHSSIWVAEWSQPVVWAEGSEREKSLEMGGSAYGIRTHVTAVRGRHGRLFDMGPEELR